MVAGAAFAPATLAFARGMPPRRIVSLNACLDAMVVALADRRQIAALSHYARDPVGSTVAEVAKTLPYTRETAEEVINLRADLVLASRHTGASTRNALARAGLSVESFATPKSVAQSLEQVRLIADLVGHPARGEVLVRRIEAALAAAAPPPGWRAPSALIFQPNGFAAGPGTLADEMMRRAGFENAARRYGLKAWGNVPLEHLLADPPQVLLIGEPAPGARRWADRVMTHPALRGRGVGIRQAMLPERYLYCGGPVLIAAASALQAARRTLMGS